MGATVLQLSDTHLAPTRGEAVFDRDADARLRTVLDAWKATGERADLILLTGDLTNEGGVAATRRLADTVGALNVPMLALPGNHDRPEEVEAAFGPADHMELDGWRILTFDTTVPGQVHGSIHPATALARVDSLDDRPTVVALHHPPISRSTAAQFQLEGAAELLAGLGSRPHVRAVVAGHLHDPFELAGPGGLPVLGCPATVIAITHQGDDMTIEEHGTTGARVLRLDDDGRLTSRVLQA